MTSVSGGQANLTEADVVEVTLRFELTCSDKSFHSLGEVGHWNIGERLGDLV